VASDDDRESYDGAARNAPYPLSRLSAPIDLVRVAEEVLTADATLASVTGAKLEAIVKQIRQLQAEAAQVLDRARRDAELHRASCRLSKRAGTVYHLYRRSEAELYFSLLSPADWKDSPPHAYEGSFRLEPDMSWTALEEIGERDAHRTLIAGLLGSR
jgi:hypothetical protein